MPTFIQIRPGGESRRDLLIPCSASFLGPDFVSSCCYQREEEGERMAQTGGESGGGGGGAEEERSSHNNKGGPKSVKAVLEKLR